MSATFKPPELYARAAVLYIAKGEDGEEECYRHGCDQRPTVCFTFLADDTATQEIGEAFVYLCRTHMHGWLGMFIDKGEPVPEDEVGA